MSKGVCRRWLWESDSQRTSPYSIVHEHSFKIKMSAVYVKPF
jgi:hypothetical protein